MILAVLQRVSYTHEKYKQGLTSMFGQNATLWGNHPVQYLKIIRVMQIILNSHECGEKAS